MEIYSTTENDRVGEQDKKGKKHMTEKQSPLTYEGVLELFRETREQFRETREQMKENDRRYELRSQELDRKFQETDRKIQETNKQISSLGSRIGEIVEHMIGDDIVTQFQALGYSIKRYGRNFVFGQRGTEESGEVDLYIEDGDVAILIEAKTNLKNADVLEHIERLEKYRRCIDEAGSDNRRFIGAVAGAVVEENVAAFAQNNGFYVIAQSGRAFEIVPSPEGFVPKKW